MTEKYLHFISLPCVAIIFFDEYLLKILTWLALKNLIFSPLSYYLISVLLILRSSWLFDANHHYMIITVLCCDHTQFLWVTHTRIIFLKESQPHHHHDHIQIVVKLLMRRNICGWLLLCVYACLLGRTHIIILYWFL